MARTFQIKRGLRANLPTLAQGEFAMTTDSGSEVLWLGTGSQNKKIPLNPTAADVGALARDGSNTMTGLLKSPNGIAVNKLRVEDWGSGEALIRFYDRNGGGNRYISIWDKTKTDSLKTALLFGEEMNGVYTVNQILHTGNKPSGSYTGNGSAASRAIHIGGTGGSNLLVQTNSTMIWVTGYGAILFRLSDSFVKAFSGNEMYFDGTTGLLTIASADGLINYNGATYHYQRV